MSKRKPETIDPFNERAGGRVRDARLEADVGQAELGRLLGFSSGSTLYRYEAGLRPFTLRHLVILSERLDRSINWFLTGRDFRPASSRKRRPDDPIEALRDSGVCGALTDEEVLALHTHLRAGNSRALPDLEVLVKRLRFAARGGEEAMRILLEAEDRRRASKGVVMQSTTPPSAAPRRRKSDRPTR